MDVGGAYEYCMQP